MTNTLSYSSSRMRTPPPEEHKVRPNHSFAHDRGVGGHTNNKSEKRDGGGLLTSYHALQAPLFTSRTTTTETAAASDRPRWRVKRQDDECLLTPAVLLSRSVAARGLVFTLRVGTRGAEDRDVAADDADEKERDPLGCKNWPTRERERVSEGGLAQRSSGRKNRGETSPPRT